MAKKAYAGNEKNIRSVRFKEIRRLISEETIGTQQALLKRLQELGYDVTQGTISRDIRDLKLVKVSVPGVGYRYQSAKASRDSAMSDQFYTLFRSSVIRVDSALNQVVIRCYNGMAGAVCASMDTLEWDGMLGTVAGDDTILVILKSEAQAESLLKKLREI